MVGLLTVLLAYAVISVRQMVLNTLWAKGAADFHSYWYAGLFVLQGTDPYAAFIAGDTPGLPVYHLGGSVTTSFEALPTSPANTALMVLTLSSLSLLKWETAKVVWLGLNLVAALATPVLAITLLPVPIPRWLKVMSVPGYLAFAGTRQAIGNGQTTVLVILLMLLSLLVFKRGTLWAAGLLLGLALSKYSLSVPLAIFFVWNRHWAILLAAIATQMAGFLALAALTDTSPISTVSAYYEVARRHLGHPGVHLSAALPAGTSPLLQLAVTAFSLGAACLLLRPILVEQPPTAARRSSRGALSWQEWAVLSAFSAWTLVGVYHSFYDTGLLLVPILFLTGAAALRQAGNLALAADRCLILGLLLCVAWLAHPGSLIRLYVPQWDAISARVTTAIILGLFSAVVWLGRRQE